jgi:LPXTG-site transpeptidase (sortase) family protein
MLRSPKLLLPIAVVGLIASAVVVVLALENDENAPPVAAVLPTQSISTPSPTPVPEPTPTVEPTVAPEIPIARLVIPSIGVNAEVVIKGVTADGVMEDPKGPWEVAWYNFSALPNRVGNVVMAGHLDYVNVGAAVFYKLGSLKEGDEVVINLVNGETATYKVTTVASYNASTAPVQEIVGPTPVETVTLITCGGAFNRATREYDSRVIVRAERVLDAA